MYNGTTIIRHLIQVAKRRLLSNNLVYYTDMKDVEYSFYCIKEGSYIQIETANREYFKSKFNMVDDVYDFGNALTLRYDYNYDSYYTLYLNALIVMLEQTLINPRPIIRNKDNTIMKHMPGPIDGIDYQYIDYFKGDATYVEYDGSDDDDKTTTMSSDEYIDYIKKTWNNINTAYNIYIFDSNILHYDTYPAL